MSRLQQSNITALKWYAIIVYVYVYHHHTICSNTTHAHLTEPFKYNQGELNLTTAPIVYSSKKVV